MRVNKINKLYSEYPSEEIVVRAKDIAPIIDVLLLHVHQLYLNKN